MTEENTAKKDECCDKEKAQKAEGSCSTEKSADAKKEGSCGCG